MVDLRSGCWMREWTDLGTLLLLLPPLLTQFDYSTQNADEDVRVDAPLMSFVNDDHRVLGQQEVCREFSE